MRITLVNGDITAQHVDVIVNAANSSLLGGGGVDGAIHRAGGPDILAECRLIRAGAWPGGLPAGRSVLTAAGNLHARWVIHTVGPRWSPHPAQPAVLAACYASALRLADSLGAQTIAFPAVGAGAYGWPARDAARIAVRAVRRSRARVGEVRFVLAGEEMMACFRDAVHGPWWLAGLRRAR